MTEKKLSLFGFVCNVLHQEDDKSERNIMLYSHHRDTIANTIHDLSEVIRRCDVLRVKNEKKGTFETSSYVHWELGNTSISRKKLEPILRQFYRF